MMVAGTTVEVKAFVVTALAVDVNVEVEVGPVATQEQKAVTKLSAMPMGATNISANPQPDGIQQGLCSIRFTWEVQVLLSQCFQIRRICALFLLSGIERKVMFGCRSRIKIGSSRCNGGR